MKRDSWTTRIGFYLVAIGSPCGLGNIWRFPYVVGENGGGAFILVYLLLVFILGLPLLIAELALGRSQKKSIILALANLTIAHKKKYKWLGIAMTIFCLLVFAYYTLISTWVLFFSVHFFSKLFMQQASLANSGFSLILNNFWLLVALVFIHLFICSMIISKGVQAGLEKFIGWTVPVFGILLLFLVAKSFSSGATESALRFLFYPDFSKLNYSSLGQAIGQVLFTMSAGFGIMVTFGSYMNDEHIPTASFRVAIIDTIIAIISGLLIFPIALQASNITLTDPGLIFDLIPEFLNTIFGGKIYAFIFFVCLYIASLGASIGLLEVIVSNWMEIKKISRTKSTLLTSSITVAIAVLFAIPGAISHNIKIFEFADNSVINWILPVIALVFCVFFSRGMPFEKKQQMFVSVNKIESVAMYSSWLICLKWLIPVLIVVGLVLQFVDVLIK